MIELQIAQTIKEQLGNKAICMIGAREFIAGKDNLRFRFGSKRKGMNVIIITLTSDDLYKIDFCELRGIKFGIHQSVSGISANNLHSVIAYIIGMRLSL